MDDDISGATMEESVIHASPQPHCSDSHSSPSHGILLSKFFIGEKNYRVLLDDECIVWDCLDSNIVQQESMASTTHFHEDIERTDSRDHSVDCRKVVEIRDVICVRRDACYKVDVSREQHLLIVHYAARLVRSSSDCNRWSVHSLSLYNADSAVIQQWHDVLANRLQQSARVQRLLVVVNPYGGRKRGLRTYERHCKPLLQLAGIDTLCIVTQRRDEIYDLLLSCDLEAYDGVCCVGGDGTVAETMNGLLVRAIRDAGLNERRPAFVPKPSLPVAIIPAGSTNTVAYSLHGTTDVRTATIHLVLGQRRGLDVCSVQNGDGIIRFCVSVLSYGYLGDVATSSEKYRWMGPSRYEFAGVGAFLKNRGYDAEIRLLRSYTTDDHLAKEIERNNVPSVALDKAPCYVKCHSCLDALTNRNAIEGDGKGYPVDAITVDVLNNKVATEGAEMAVADTHREARTPLSGRGAQWHVVNGNFFMVCGTNISCACSRSPNGISRYNHLGNGHLDLILVRKTSLLNNVRFLLNTLRSDGDIRDLPFVEMYRTRTFTLRITKKASVTNAAGSRLSKLCCRFKSDVQKADATASCWNCDGEIVKESTLTMSSHCQVIDVFMRGPHLYASEHVVGKRSICSCCSGNNN